MGKMHSIVVVCMYVEAGNDLFFLSSVDGARTQAEVWEEGLV